MASPNAARTIRDRAREELTAEIKATARAQLAAKGAEALSLRAVSRELGMVSSALYRYFPSRDALLTALIIDAYNSLGEACEAAEAACDRADVLDRWRSIVRTTRRWAINHPHEYALIYGTPIPGFAAPDDTIDPATRVTRLMLVLMVDIERSIGPLTTDPRPAQREESSSDDPPPGNVSSFGAPSIHAPPIHAPPVHAPPVGPVLAAQLEAVTAELPGQVDQARLLIGLGAWALVFGMISFELFGTFRNTFDDAEPLFDYHVDLAAKHMGLLT